VSALEDAMVLLNEMTPSYQGMCLFCYGVEDQPGPYGRTQHKSDCVYVRRDRIIAVLEAAERLPGEEPVTEGSGGYIAYTICGDDAVTGNHAPDCPYQALVTALKGEVVPS
jgi:hypothetical protein